MLSYLYLYNEFTFIHKFIRLLLLVTSIIIKKYKPYCFNTPTYDIRVQCNKNESIRENKSNLTG
jgi:hypothetical protein